MLVVNRGRKLLASPASTHYLATTLSPSWKLLPLGAEYTAPLVEFRRHDNTACHRPVVGSASKAEGWIYLLITGTTLPYNNLHRNYIPAAHPVSPLDPNGRAFLKTR